MQMTHDDVHQQYTMNRIDWKSQWLYVLRRDRSPAIIDEYCDTHPLFQKLDDLIFHWQLILILEGGRCIRALIGAGVLWGGDIRSIWPGIVALITTDDSTITIASSSQITANDGTLNSTSSKMFDWCNSVCSSSTQSWNWLKDQ